MDLILIRHAEPDYANDTITPTGHRQAQALAERVVDLKIDRLFVSPLGRARHTAEHISAARNQDPQVVDFFQELDGCYSDGNYAWDYHGCDLLSDGIEITRGNWHSLTPYGDHMLPVFKAFTSSLDSFLSDFGLNRSGDLYTSPTSEDLTAAVVCHAGVIATALSHLLHIPLPTAYSQFRVDPASITRLRLETKNGTAVFRLMTLNDTQHTEAVSGATEYRTPQR